MKLLMVIASDEVSELVSFYIKPLGCNLIHYRYVIKAMDNLDEIQADAIIISASDFPCHWKTLLQFIQCTAHRVPKPACPMILLRGDYFPLEEAAKAFYMGVAALLDERLDRPSDIDTLRRVIQSLAPASVSEQDTRRFGFLLVNPVNDRLVTGEVKGVSEVQLSFYPLSSMWDIPLNTVLEECSLRAGDAILSPRCAFIRHGRVVLLRFLSFPADEGAIFAACLRALL
ncbi:MAG: PilZ domain-containing protein [Treponema sp.]|jgi:hypothetical protein|nr:PilZ domain-containing protein [Treponema sp.]